MERLRGLAAEVLALPNLTAHQRLVWATSLRLEAVPMQERSDRVAACVREVGHQTSLPQKVCFFFLVGNGRITESRGISPAWEGQEKRSALAATDSKEEQRCLTSSDSDAIFQVGPFPLACLKQELPPWFWERMNITRRTPGNWGRVLECSAFFPWQELLRYPSDPALDLGNRSKQVRFLLLPPPTMPQLQESVPLCWASRTQHVSATFARDNKRHAALRSGPCHSGVDLLSLDGRRAIRCCAEAVEFPQVRRFLRLARWVYKANKGCLRLPCHDVLRWQMCGRSVFLGLSSGDSVEAARHTAMRRQAADCMLVTNSTKLLSPQSATWLRRSKARRRTMSVTAAPRLGEGERWPQLGLACDRMVFGHCRITGWRSMWLVTEPGFLVRPLRSGASTAASDSCNAADAPLRRCQRDCLAACAKGARVIEMACGTGKTRVIKELVGNISGRVPWLAISG